VLPSTLRNSKSPAQRAVIVILLADCAAQNPWYEDPPRSAFVKGFLPAATDSDPECAWQWQGRSKIGGD